MKEFRHPNYTGFYIDNEGTIELTRAFLITIVEKDEQGKFLAEFSDLSGNYDIEGIIMKSAGSSPEKIEFEKMGVSSEMCEYPNPLMLEYRCERISSSKQGKAYEGEITAVLDIYEGKKRRGMSKTKFRLETFKKNTHSYIAERISTNQKPYKP